MTDALDTRARTPLETSPPPGDRRDRLAASPHRAAIREAITVPWLLLASAALASASFGERGALAFAAPPLMTLILGVLFVGLLARVGVLDPPALVGPHRRGLENASGIVVLVLLGGASAQVIAALTPDRGIFAFVVTTYFLFLFLSTMAARPTPDRAMRSLAITFGGVLVLKYVVLSGLAEPGGTLARRLFAATLDGVTLGAVGAAYQPPARGYVVFAAVLLLFIALAALPRRGRW